jgi:hypothetical protein
MTEQEIMTRFAWMQNNLSWCGDYAAIKALAEALTEARAALNDVPIEWGRPLFAADAERWLKKYDATLKAAREAK